MSNQITHKKISKADYENGQKKIWKIIKHHIPELKTLWENTTPNIRHSLYSEWLWEVGKKPHSKNSTIIALKSFDCLSRDFKIFFYSKITIAIYRQRALKSLIVGLEQLQPAFWEPASILYDMIRNTKISSFQSHKHAELVKLMKNITKDRQEIKKLHDVFSAELDLIEKNPMEFIR